MIVVEHTILSDSIAEEAFVCDLHKCKGACCEEGDSGAPLEEEETLILEREFAQIAPFLTPEGKIEIEQQGKWVIDFEGDFTTPTIQNKACAYAIKDANQVWTCGIENAWKAGKTSFRKPISCHLYPARLKKYDHYIAVNYHSWNICAPACTLGEALKIPVYVFLKDAFIRRFGADWYAKLENEIASKSDNSPNI